MHTSVKTLGLNHWYFEHSFKLSFHDVHLRLDFGDFVAQNTELLMLVEVRECVRSGKRFETYSPPLTTLKSNKYNRAARKK
jgi:hypothetical protein